MQQLRELLERALVILEKVPAPEMSSEEPLPEVTLEIISLLKDSRALFEKLDTTPSPLVPPYRCKLPDERLGRTHKVTIPSPAVTITCPKCKHNLAEDGPPGNFEAYFTINDYPDGKVGEMFIRTSPEGSFARGMTDAFATAISMLIQVGYPLDQLVAKFINTRFEPQGLTNDATIPLAKSLLDFIFRWIGLRYLPEESQLRLGIIGR